MPRRPLRYALAVLAVGLGLTGCAGTVPMHPAPDANNPLCAEVMVRLPDSIDGEDRRWTDAQATAAWGSPAKVLFTCGVEPPGPTTLDCVQVSSVDWIVDETDAPRFRVTTYGRTPAVELFIDTEVTEDGHVGVSSRTVLDALSPIINQNLPRDRECIPREDATQVPVPDADEPDSDESRSEESETGD